MRVSASLRTHFLLAAFVPLVLAMAAAWAIATVVFTHTLQQRVEALEAMVLRESLLRAIELNPGLTDAYTVLGRVYYCTERHAEAQAALPAPSASEPSP